MRQAACSRMRGHFWVQMSTLILINFSQSVMLTLPFTLSVYMVRRFLQQGLDEGQQVDEGQVSRLTGLLAAVFSMAQFVTSVLWGTLSNMVGRKAVIVIGTAVSLITLVWYGMASSYTEAVASRIVGGLLNGILGAWKCIIGETGDTLIQGKMFAYMSVAWGLGTTVGPLIGGILARPCDRFPDMALCEPGQLLYERPFALPCLVGSSSLLVCLVATIFLLNETLPDELQQEQLSSLQQKLHGLQQFLAGGCCCCLTSSDLHRHVTPSSWQYASLKFVDVEQPSQHPPRPFAAQLEHTNFGYHGAKLGNTKQQFPLQGSAEDVEHERLGGSIRTAQHSSACASAGNLTAGKRDAYNEGVSHVCLEHTSSSPLLQSTSSSNMLGRQSRSSLTASSLSCQSSSLQPAAVSLAFTESEPECGVQSMVFNQQQRRVQVMALLPPAMPCRTTVPGSTATDAGVGRAVLQRAASAGVVYESGRVVTAGAGAVGDSSQLAGIGQEAETVLPEGEQLAGRAFAGVQQESTDVSATAALYCKSSTREQATYSHAEPSTALQCAAGLSNTRPPLQHACEHAPLGDSKVPPSPLPSPSLLRAFDSVSSPVQASPSIHRRMSVRERMAALMRSGSRIYLSPQWNPFQRAAIVSPCKDCDGNRQDGDMQATRPLLQTSKPSSCTAPLMHKHMDDSSIKLEQSCESAFGEGPGERGREGADLPPWHHNRDVVLAILGYGFVSFLYCAVDEVIPIFAAAPPQEGGLGFAEADLAPPITFYGVTLMIYSAWIYPWLQQAVGTLRLTKYGLLAAVVVCAMLPLAHTSLAVSTTFCYITLFSIMALKTFAQASSFTGALVMVNAAPHKSQLGSVNGVGQTVASLVRGLGPALGGLLWALSLQLHAPGQQFLPFAMISLLALAAVQIYQRVRLPELK